MIDLPEKDLELVRAILRREVPDCEVRAFGSRVTGRARKYSDLDLAIVSDAPLDWSRLEALKDAFAESDLPILVDVLEWNSISADFRQRVADQFEILSISDECL